MCTSETLAPAGVTVTLGNEQSYQNAANEIEQNIYNTKWYNDDNGLNTVGIVTGSIETGISAGTGVALLKVVRNYKSARNPISFYKLRHNQQAWRITNTLGKNGAKYLKYAKGTGVLGSVASVGISGYKIYEATATTIDYVDAGVGMASLGATIFLVSNPVGWAIGAGAGIYFAGRLAYDIYNEVND